MTAKEKLKAIYEETGLRYKSVKSKMLFVIGKKDIPVTIH
jgi:hypothetical protein